MQIANQNVEMVLIVILSSFIITHFRFHLIETGLTGSY